MENNGQAKTEGENRKFLSSIAFRIFFTKNCQKLIHFYFRAILSAFEIRQTVLPLIR